MHSFAIDALRVELPGRVLVDDFTAVLPHNDFVALVGLNGAGKSSPSSAIVRRRMGRRALAHQLRQRGSVRICRTCRSTRRCMMPSRNIGRCEAVVRYRIFWVRSASAATMCYGRSRA